MIRLRHKLFIHTLRVLDQAYLLACLALIVQLDRGRFGPGVRSLAERNLDFLDLSGILVIGLCFNLIFSCFIRYDTDRLTELHTQIKDLLKATAASSFALILVCALFGFARISTAHIALFWGVTSAVGILSRLLLCAFLNGLRRSGYNRRHLLIVGANSRALDIARRIESSSELGYRIVGFIAEPGEADCPRFLSTNGAPHQPHFARPAEPFAASPLSSRAEPALAVAEFPSHNGAQHHFPGDTIRTGTRAARCLGRLDALKSVIGRGTIDEVLICLPVEEHFRSIAEAVQCSYDLGVVVRILPECGTATMMRRFQIEHFEGERVVTLFREQMLFRLFVKRIIDLVVSLLGLLILSPLLVAVSVAVKASSPGPILFLQERVGMNKRRFHLIKFRSMRADAEQRRAELAAMNEMDGPAFKMKNDPRVTPLGRFLRKTSIDELPQLINVLRGEMSLVGPRPPIPSEVDQYEWMYRKRLSIKPGITCLWQVNGRSSTTFKQWMEYDKEYVENWSLWLDLKILLKTIPAVIFPKGAC
jgi:exopolysaccharide biosynthesis polyprenyl glycosylphosphotransferase